MLRSLEDMPWGGVHDAPFSRVVVVVSRGHHWHQSVTADALKNACVYITDGEEPRALPVPCLSATQGTATTLMYKYTEVPDAAFFFFFLTFPGNEH